MSIIERAEQARLARVAAYNARKAAKETGSDINQEIQEDNTKTPANDFEAACQEETDSLGYHKETEHNSFEDTFNNEGIQVMNDMAEYKGNVSESLILATLDRPVDITGKLIDGNTVTMRITQNGKFLNFEQCVDGYPIGVRGLVAVRHDKDGGWYYAPKFQASLASLGSQGSPEHWARQLHLFHRA